jgi:tRNA(Glu) U13 pseudouridine synthase TruD
MKYILTKDTFFVKEILNPKLESEGIYNYYLLTKSGISDKESRRRVPRDALFCGKKDRNATTTQWFCSKYKIDDINEENFKIEYKGVSNEKLFVGVHKGNKFSVIIELNEEEVKKLKKINFKRIEIANYFGKQRFDERIDELKKYLEKEDYERALKHFLCSESKFDSEKSTIIKNEIKENWKDWEVLEKSEKLPESKRPIFEFLKNKEDYLKAFEFVERKSLVTTLRAIEAKRFNELLHNLINEKVKNNYNEKIASKNIKKKIEIEATQFEKKFGINKLIRNTYFYAKGFKIKKLENNKFEMYFTLSKGEYATIFLKAIEGLLK